MALNYYQENDYYHHLSPNFDESTENPLNEFTCCKDEGCLLHQFEKYSTSLTNNNITNPTAPNLQPEIAIKFDENQNELQISTGEALITGVRTPSSSASSLSTTTSFSSMALNRAPDGTQNTKEQYEEKPIIIEKGRRTKAGKVKGTKKNYNDKSHDSNHRNKRAQLNFKKKVDVVPTLDKHQHEIPQEIQHIPQQHQQERNNQQLYQIQRQLPIQQQQQFQEQYHQKQIQHQQQQQQIMLHMKQPQILYEEKVQWQQQQPIPIHKRQPQIPWQQQQSEQKQYQNIPLQQQIHLPEQLWEQQKHNGQIQQQQTLQRQKPQQVEKSQQGYIHLEQHHYHHHQHFLSLRQQPQQLSLPSMQQIEIHNPILQHQQQLQTEPPTQLRYVYCKN